MVRLPDVAAARRAALILFLWMSLSALPASSQSLTPNGEPVLLLEGGDWMQPRWSPDGTRLAITSARYDGIALVDVATGDVEQLTDEPGSGYGFAWSAEGDAILARVSRAEGMQRSHAVKLFDLEQREERLLTEFRPHMPTLPQWADGDASAVLVAPSGDVERVATGRLPAASKAAAPLFASAANGVRAVTSGARSELIRSFGESEVINVTPSPDGSLVAFEVVGGNLMVMDAAGGSLHDLGRGHRPTWSPDGTWIAFMVTEDDGHHFTASDLYAARADGSERVRLTATTGAREMNPSWSPDGGSIAFDNEATGAVYLLPVRY